MCVVEQAYLRRKMLGVEKRPLALAFKVVRLECFWDAWDSCPFSAADRWHSPSTLCCQGPQAVTTHMGHHVQWGTNLKPFLPHSYLGLRCLCAAALCDVCFLVCMVPKGARLQGPCSDACTCHGSCSLSLRHTRAMSGWRR